VLPTTVKGGCLDLALRAGTGGDYLFASCGVFDQATVYRTTHAESDDPWTPVLSEPGMSRTSLAIAPSNPSIVYALAAQADQVLLGVFRSDQNGDPGTWTYSPSTNTWKQLSLDVLPPQRANSRLVYDPVGKKVILFGGDQLDRLLADTWTFDVVKRKWEEHKPARSPSPKSQALHERPTPPRHQPPPRTKIAMAVLRLHMNPESEHENRDLEPVRGPRTRRPRPPRHLRPRRLGDGHARIAGVRTTANRACSRRHRIQISISG